MKYLLGILVAMVCSVSMAQNLNSQSAATTNSTAGATNAGNAQNINFNSEAGHDSTRVKTNPTVYAPSLGSGYSPLNCANGASGGASGGYVGIAFGGPVESDPCNGRADTTILMQMGNNVRQFDPVLANKLTTAAINTMCDQSDKLRAKMVAQGLCDTSDYPGNKRTYSAVARGPAVGEYPNTGGN